MIKVITIDRDGHKHDVNAIERVTVNDLGNVVQREALVYPLTDVPGVELTPDMPVGDLIYIRPDWPPIGSADFAAKLRLWHAQQACLVLDENL